MICYRYHHRVTSLILLALLLLATGTAAQPGCVPSAGCLATSQCPTGSLYCENITLANSITDWSAVQGQRGWSYGARDSVTNFTQFTIWDPTSGDCGIHGRVVYPGTWSNAVDSILLMCADGGHPFFGQVVAVRRFTASMAMTVTVSTQFANVQQIDDPSACPGADGTTGMIRYNNGGSVLWNYNDNTRTGVFVPFSFTLAVQPGDTLDFEIWPNANANCDGTVFSVTIMGLCASNTCANVVCNYSATPCSCASPWSGSDCSLLATTTTAAAQAVTTVTTSVTTTAARATSIGASTVVLSTTAAAATSSSSSFSITTMIVPSSLAPQTVVIDGLEQVSGSWVATAVTIFTGNVSTTARLTVDGPAVLGGEVIVQLPEVLTDTHRVRLILADSVTGSFVSVTVRGPPGDCTRYMTHPLVLATLYAVDVTASTSDTSCPVKTDRPWLIFACVISSVFAVTIILAAIVLWIEECRPDLQPHWLGRVRRLNPDDIYWR